MIDFSSITNSWGYILEGVKYTIELTVITAIGGLILGTGLALCRLSTSKILSEFSKLYTNLMRAVPLVLVLFWFFLLMPEVLKVLLGLDHPVMIGAEMTAIITFVLFEAAYFAEIMRAGIQSVSKGQMSAAMALGLRSKIAQRDGQLVLMYSFAAVCYLTVSVSLSMLVRRLQRKIAVAAR